MRTALVITAAIAATLSLAACQKPAGNAAANTAAGSTPAAASATPAAGGGSMAPGDMPHAKPGMWKMKMSNSMMPRTIETTHCVTPEETKIDWSSNKQVSSHCGTPDISRGLDGSIHVKTSCDMGQGAGHIDSDARASGDFNSHYSIHVDQTISGAPLAQMNGQHTMDIDSTYMGPCTK